MKIEYFPTDINDLYQSYLTPEELIYFDNNWHKFQKKSVCKIALQYGWFDLLKWARENGGLLNEEIYSLAAKYDNMDMLKWVKSNLNGLQNKWDTTWDAITCDYAAFNGNTEMLKWL